MSTEQSNCSLHWICCKAGWALLASIFYRYYASSGLTYIAGPCLLTCTFISLISSGSGLDGMLFPNLYKAQFVGRSDQQYPSNMKLLFPMFAWFTLASCMTNYKMTTFYVKNNTNQIVNFKASVDKLSSMGSFIMTLPFIVLPSDSVLARKVQLRKDAPPTAWFTQLIIFPVDSVRLNDPNDANNWIKSTNAKGKQIYTFNVAQ